MQVSLVYATERAAAIVDYDERVQSSKETRICLEKKFLELPPPLRTNHPKGTKMLIKTKRKIKSQSTYEDKRRSHGMEKFAVSPTTFGIEKYTLIKNRVFYTVHALIIGGVMEAH